MYRFALVRSRASAVDLQLLAGIRFIAYRVGAWDLSTLGCHPSPGEYRGEMLAHHPRKRLLREALDRGDLSLVQEEVQGEEDEFWSGGNNLLKRRIERRDPDAGQRRWQRRSA